MKDLIAACYTNGRCSDGEMACDVLEETLGELMAEGWQIGAEMPVKGYKLRIYHKEEEKELLSIEEGSCIGMISGSDIPLPIYSGTIKLELEICS